MIRNEVVPAEIDICHISWWMALQNHFQMFYWEEHENFKTLRSYFTFKLERKFQNNWIGCRSDFYYRFSSVVLIVRFTRYFMFSIPVLPHSSGVAYYHLLLRREARISGDSFQFQKSIANGYISIHFKFALKSYL